MDGPSIGAPIANAEAYVLDKEMEPVPIGIAGELYIGGEVLARGYEGQAAATAERFVPHPFSQRAGQRLHPTGDLVRWQPTGRLDFLGRIDHQIKIRGYRVELEEIESVLEQHADVLRAAVMVSGKESSERRLIAYVVGKKAGEQSTPGSCRDIWERGCRNTWCQER